jgi:hypothetical protein
MLRGDYEATITDDITLFLDSLSNYHLFIAAGIEEYDEPTLTWLEFQPYFPSVLAFLQGGGSAYWEGAVAFNGIAQAAGPIFDYFLAWPEMAFSYILDLSGRDGTCFGDLDSLVYDFNLSWTYQLSCECGVNGLVLRGRRPEGGAPAKGVAAAVGQTRTMLTNFSWARLNDSGTNSRVDLIDDVMEWLSGAVAVEEPEPLPSAYSLLPPYPNPFNAQVTIEYALPNEAAVSLSVFDIQGRKVATLIEGMKPAGYHRLTWDAKSMPSGLYFMRLTAGEFVETRKMTLLK